LHSSLCVYASQIGYDISFPFCYKEYNIKKNFSEKEKSNSANHKKILVDMLLKIPEWEATHQMSKKSEMFK